MECDESRRSQRRLRSLGLRTAAALVISLPISLVAAPLILEPTASIQIPDSYFTIAEDVDIDGNSMILGARRVDNIQATGETFVTDTAFIFQKDPASGSWGFGGKLFEQRWLKEDDSFTPLRVAMQNGVAAVNTFFGPLRIYERVNGAWVAATAQGHFKGRNIEIDAGTILGSEDLCGWGAEAFRKNASGAYVRTQTYEGVFDYCDDGRVAGDADLSGTRVVVPQPQASDDPSFVPGTFIWEGLPPSAPASIPEVGSVSIEGDWIGILAARERTLGTHFYRRQGLGNWLHQQTITMPDELLSQPQDSFVRGGNVQMEEGFVLVTRSGRIDVFRRDANARYQYVAKLLGAERGNVSQRTVVGVLGNTVRVFDLPQTLVQAELRQDDFEDRNAADWTPQAGSSFNVVAANGSYVYRQSSLAGNAISILGNSELGNQAIQVDVRPTAFAAGTDRWFGVIARYTDASNYYYVTTRQSNVIHLRRMMNGTFVSLASAPLPVALNRTYNLRLEAIGSLLRVYVDNKQVLEARDHAHARGQVGVMTYKTSANYDNVLVSTQQMLPLLTDDFASFVPNRWQESGGAWGQANEPQWVYEQSSLAGTARSITGIATGDQSVQVVAKPTSFASGTERWFGVVARYVDASNYYYVTLRTNNTISLRKLVNGGIQVLDSAPLQVRAGTSYRLRLDAIGNSLRVFVNGTHVLEATDTTFPAGKYGLATYKASAQFDDFSASQP